MTKAEQRLRDHEKMNTEYMEYLIAENWQKDLDDLTDDVLNLYVIRLRDLFMDDNAHLSIHDLAYALCERGLSAKDDGIYDLAESIRY